MTTPVRSIYVLGAALTSMVLAASGVVVATPAAADTKTYLQKIHDAGIHTPGGDVELKEWGWTICELFNRGASPEQALLHAVYNSGSTPPYDLSEEQANLIVDSAAHDLCTDRK